MERVPKGRETREERLFFPVGTDRPARRRPAALDHPVSPVPGIGPAGLESSVPRRAVYQPRASQPGSLSQLRFSQLRFAEPFCLQIAPRSACVLTRRSTIPQGTRGGFAHPAAADAAASALRALRRGPAPWAPRPPGPSRMCPVSAATQSSASCGLAVPALQSSLLSLWWLSVFHVSRGRARRMTRRN